jgi:hypothetical protein
MAKKSKTASQKAAVFANQTEAMDPASNMSCEVACMQEEPVSHHEKRESAVPMDTVKGRGASEDRTANGIEHNEDEITTIAMPVIQAEGMCLPERCRTEI